MTGSAGPEQQAAVPDERQFRRWRLDLFVWLAAWLVIAIPAFLWFDQFLAAHLDTWRGAHTLILIVVVSIALSLAPPLAALKLAFGRYHTLEARYAKLVEEDRARRARPLGNHVREWSVFTRVLVIVVFGGMGLFLAVPGALLLILNRDGSSAWILAVGVAMTIPAVLVARAWIKG